MQMLSRDPARRPPDLTEVARLFASYTRAVVPAFGPASTGKSWLTPLGDSAQARALDATKAQDVKPADPRGPTLLSTPAVPSSVTVVADEASERKKRSHKRGVLIAGGALALAAGVLWLRFGAATKPEGAPRNGAELASSAAPNPASPTPAPTVTPGAMATTASDAPPAPSQAAKTTARRSRPMPRPTSVPGASARVRAPEEVATTRPAKDEAELFSGRK